MDAAVARLKGLGADLVTTEHKLKEDLSECGGREGRRRRRGVNSEPMP